MSLNYGRPANPEGFVIRQLETLGLDVGPERDEETTLPCYVVTSVSPTHDKHLLQALVSVHTFATGTTSAMGRAAASQAAWDADNHLISLTPGDLVTMEDGRTAGAWVECKMAPTFANYGDPLIKRYAARYNVLLRFTRTT